MTNVAFLPREVINWLDSLDLAYSIRNVKRDLSNGFVIAEILTRCFPKELNIYTFDNGLRVEKKLDNWDQISKFLRRRDFILPKEEYEPIANYAPDAALKFMKRLYEFLMQGKKKFPEHPKGRVVEPRPHYAKPTAAMLSKDRELVRIVDQDEMKAKTAYFLTMHIEQKKVEHKNMNIQKFINDKRIKEQMKRLLAEQNAKLIGKAKTATVQQQQPPQLEVKELQLKALNSSTSKKTKEAPTLIMEAKGVVEFLSDLSKDHIEGPNGIIERDLSDIKNEGNLIPIQFVLTKCKEVSNDALNSLIHSYKDSVPGIVERVNNNFSDFKKFFTLMLVPLKDLYWKSTSFLNLIEFMKSVGLELLRTDPATTEIMFESIILNQLIDIVISYSNKREAVCSIIYSFINNDSSARYRVLKKIKERLANSLNLFISLLAIFVSFDYEEDFSDELYHMFYIYSLLALDFPSPVTRTNGLKILSEILYINYIPVLTVISKLQNLAKDDWWEVRSLILIICSSLLQYIARSKESAQDKIASLPNSPIANKKMNINNDEMMELEPQNHDIIPEVQNEEIQDIVDLGDDLQVNTYENEETFLLQLLTTIFSKNTNQNILKIGLIYLAPVLNKYPALCERYLEILLSVSDEVRTPVLDINPIPGGEEGYIVLGSNSFKYKLTGAPLLWNSVGIAEALETFVRTKELENFEKEHIEILAGCLVQPLEVKDSEIWLRIYENLKSYIFIGLCDRELCTSCGEVLKKFFTFDNIQNDVLKNSTKIFYKTLTLLYHPDREMNCKENLLDFFDYLHNSGNEKFKEYNYETIKEFSERNKVQFLQSNLVNFMNNIAKERRLKMFSGNIFN